MGRYVCSYWLWQIHISGRWNVLFLAEIYSQSIPAAPLDNVAKRWRHIFHVVRKFMRYQILSPYVWDKIGLTHVVCINICNWQVPLISCAHISTKKANIITLSFSRNSWRIRNWNVWISVIQNENPIIYRTTYCVDFGVFSEW